MARGFMLMNTLGSLWHSTLAAIAWLLYTLLGVKLIVGERAAPPPKQRVILGAGRKKLTLSTKGLREKQEFERKYHLKEDLVLGEGGFAKVCIGTLRENDEDVAIKIISRKNTKEHTAAIDKEIAIMKKAQHPNIIQFIDMYELDDRMYIVMELVRGGELFDRICDKAQYKESEAAAFAQDILSALEYLHSLGIVHRDIKPQNILYATEADNSPVKLADFGLSAIFDGQTDRTMKTVCGTLGFAAPEVMQELPEARGYDSKCDIWSAGVILYMLLCGEPPFDFGSPLLVKEIQHGFPDKPEVWNGVSSDAKDLVSAMMQLDPAARPSAASCRAHSWFPLATERELSCSTEALSSTQQRLKVWNAGQRLRNTIYSVKTLDVLARRQAADQPSWRSQRSAIAKLRQDPRKLEELRSTFEMLDRDQTGRISVDNLTALFQGMGGTWLQRIGGGDVGMVPTREEVEGMVSRFDQQGDGCLDFEDFIGLLAPKIQRKATSPSPGSPTGLERMRSDEIHMRAAFDFFDTEGTGRITTEQLQAAFVKLDLPHTEEELMHMVQAADINGDGEISFEEFCKLTMNSRTWSSENTLPMSDYILGSDVDLLDLGATLIDDLNLQTPPPTPPLHPTPPSNRPSTAITGPASEKA